MHTSGGKSLEVKTGSRPARSSEKSVSKLADAREKKQSKLAQSVAATAASATPRSYKPKVKNLMLPVEVIAQVDKRVADYLIQTGNSVSWSAVGEIALLELIARDDFNELVKGARARRPT